MSKKGILIVAGVATGIVVVLAAVIGIHFYFQGNLSKARQIAANLEASALAHPNPVVSSTTATSPTTGHPAVAGNSHSASPTTGQVPTTTGHAPSTHGSGSRSSATAGGSPSAGKSTTGSIASTSSARVISGATAGSTGTAGTAKSGSTKAPRTQPSAAEVQQAITAVHTLVPFYTPTAADIASAGNDVCTAFDNGASISAVETAALNMIGAGSYASFIPSADTQIAIQTLVVLYCPAYLGKVH